MGLDGKDRKINDGEGNREREGLFGADETHDKTEKYKDEYFDDDPKAGEDEDDHEDDYEYNYDDIDNDELVSDEDPVEDSDFSGDVDVLDDEIVDAGSVVDDDLLFNDISNDLFDDTSLLFNNDISSASISASEAILTTPTTDRATKI